MDTLIEADWLIRHLDDPQLRILECSVTFVDAADGTISFHSGRADWEKGHIPGSAFADLIDDLADPESQLDFTLPSAERFARAMGALGVGKGTQVVLYDRTYGMWATRLWWMLRAFGFDDAAVLNGGFAAWRTAGGPIDDRPSAYALTTFEPHFRRGMFVGKDDVRAALSDPNTCLIDALRPHIYRGDQVPYARPGHIAGAINVPMVELTDADSKRFLDDDLLRERFSAALGRSSVITYCGAGIAATVDAFLLQRLGHQRVSIYDGSLSEWSADPSLPMET
jgi:thiosulfate/3-mercaptopyruvate sulfurtransferase